MALQTTHFGVTPYNQSIIQPDYSAVREFIPNVLKSYEAPIKMRQEMSTRDEALRMSQLNRALQEKYGEPIMQAKLEGLGLQNKGYGLTNALTGAKISKIKGEMANYFDQNNNSDSIPIEGMSTYERLFYAKEQAAAQQKAEKMMQMNHLLEQMKKINEANPDMGDAFEQALVADKKSVAGFINQLKRNVSLYGLDKKKLAEIEKFEKASNDYALLYSQLNPGGRQSDMYRQMVIDAKANSRNTQEANRYVLDELYKQSAGANKYYEGLKNSRKNKRVLIKGLHDYNQEALQQFVNSANPPAQQQFQQGGDSMQMPAEGSESITQEDIEFTANKYGVSIEAVKARLGIQ